MNKYKLVTKVEGHLATLYLGLEGLEIGLSYDGDATYQSTDLLNIDQHLNLVFQPVGIAFTDWEISITAFYSDGTPVKDDGKPIYKDKGTLDITNQSLIKKAIAMPLP